MSEALVQEAQVAQHTTLQTLQQSEHNLMPAGIGGGGAKIANGDSSAGVEG